METSDIILFLEIAIGILVGIIVLLICIYVYIDRKKETKEQTTAIYDQKKEEDVSTKKQRQDYGQFQGELTKESIYEFIEFDEIKDGMIIRKNRNQYVMILQCNGINYDLMSENEKVAVEEGFVQFLNTLRFPVQLYVQTRTLNLKDIISEYRNRVENVKLTVGKIDAKIAQATNSGNRSLVEKLEFERRRKINVLEYGTDITEYVERMGTNRNILQQKTFVIVSYYSAEIGGNIENFTKDEIDSMCFTELYTRCQNVASALGASQVTSSILNSEELSELLYIAYNRDEAELMQFSKVLDGEYDSLYSTGKDVYEKQKELIENQINTAAVELASDGLIKADRIHQQELWTNIERKSKIKNRAKEMLQTYEDKLDDRVFELAIGQIDKIADQKEREEKQEKENTKVKTAIPENVEIRKKKIIRRKFKEEN